MKILENAFDKLGKVSDVGLIDAEIDLVLDDLVRVVRSAVSEFVFDLHFEV